MKTALLVTLLLIFSQAKLVPFG
jgi:protein disulfide-isomerase A1